VTEQPAEDPAEDPADVDDSALPHPPSTATEEVDEGPASETDDGPEQGVSPGVG